MRSWLKPAFFFLLYGFMLYEGARLLEPFSGPLICAIAIGIVFFPMHDWLVTKLGKRSLWWAALLSDLAVLLFFVVPIGFILWAVIDEADDLLPFIKSWFDQALLWLKGNPLNSPWLEHLPMALRRQLDLSSAAAQQRLDGLANHSLTILATMSTAIAGHALSAVVDVLIFLFVLFFVFRDGEALMARLTELLPLDIKSKGEIVQKLKLTVFGVMRGTFLTALLQGACATIGFLIVQTEGAILLGVMTAFATLIPSVGTAFVWIPVALIYFLTGHIVKGIFVVAWGILVVGILDNIVRPYIVGSKADMPFLWLFLGILGGLEVFGLLGLLLGPIIVGIIPVLSEIYEQRYMPDKTS